jgi:hypothetical protein
MVLERLVKGPRREEHTPNGEERVVVEERTQKLEVLVVERKERKKGEEWALNSRRERPRGNAKVGSAGGRKESEEGGRGEGKKINRRERLEGYTGSSDGYHVHSRVASTLLYIGY